MSYARFGKDSDVYVFANVSGHLECCGCTLEKEGEWPVFWSVETLLLHLEHHARVGHAIPDYCIEQLTEEKEELDAWILSEAEAGRADHPPSSPSNPEALEGKQ